MKCRFDFVTNSSSTSYVIAYREGESAVEKIAYGLAGVLLNSTDYYETAGAEFFHTEQELREYMQDEYSWLGDSLERILAEDDKEGYYGYLRKFYQDGVKYLKEGYTIAEKSVGYDNESLLALIKLLEDSADNFIVLAKENE